MKPYTKKYRENAAPASAAARFIRPVLMVLLLGLFSCNPTKKLLPGQFLVDKVEVRNASKTNVDKEDFEAFFRQKPNRKFLRKFSFFVWWYNLFDAEKISRKKAERNLKFDKKNAEKVRKVEKRNIRRAAKGKKPKIPRLKDKESATFLESVRDIGEPAVVLDSLQTSQTTFQLSRFLFSKGYFNNTVRDTIALIRKTRKAEVTYVLNPGPAYHISSIGYDMEDPQLGAILLADTSHSLLQRGMQYDADKLQAERQRITDYARNQGYYDFENAYTGFFLDTLFEGNTLSLLIRVSNVARPAQGAEDSVVYVNHTRYTIANVYVITEPVIGKVREALFSDTLHSAKGGVKFLLNRPFAYREFLLSDNIDIYQGQYFRKDTAQKTYKQLLGLGIFKNVIIQFHVNSEHRNRLDCYIVCSPLIRQSLTAETEGTNTSGNLGIDGSIVYQNRNFFRAGELVELRMQGSIAAQSQLRVQEESGSNIGDLPRTFNTIQFGPELIFSVPRAFFPFSLLPFRKDMSPRTYVKASVNYQSRPEFSRVINSIDYGFSFKTHNNRLRHDFVPAEVYFVRARLSGAFKSTLAALNDAFLVNSFQDHVTTLSRYTLSWLSRDNSSTSRKTAHYVRWSIQSSGSLLRKYFDITGREKDSLGRYLIFGIPFAHFIRSDADYRIYLPVRKRSRVVYRLAGGIGKPLINLQGLPYEQSFFSGGPNSVRAWRARTLGPGGYDPSESSARFDKIGDILLEGNFEYRFHIIKSFHGAFFIDAGNVWRLYPDATKPGGEFLWHSFADQIAIGSGLGLRWDLNFFVLRIDVGMPVKDPKYPEGNRWTFDKQPYRNMVLNFGIGYPF